MNEVEIEAPGLKIRLTSSWTSTKKLLEYAVEFIEKEVEFIEYTDPEGYN